MKNMCVLVTRPEPQGKILCEKIHALGSSTIYLPMIAFENTSKQPAEITSYDWIIFISPRAVQYSLPFLKNFSEKTRLAALGEGTVHALNAAGFNHVIYPQTEWNSEGLLQLSFFQSLTQQKILLVRGEGGRKLLAETLTTRGAHVTHWVVYRRILPSYSPLDLSLAQKADITVCTSGEILHNMLSLTGNLLLNKPIIAISTRLMLLAKKAGFNKVFLAKNASHDAIINALQGISHAR